MKSGKQSNSHFLHQLSLSSCIQIKNLRVIGCLRKLQKTWNKFLSGSEKQQSNTSDVASNVCFPVDMGRTIRENGIIFWKAAEWSLYYRVKSNSLPLLPRQAPTCVIFPLWLSTQKPHEGGKSLPWVCTKLFLLHWTPHTRLCSSCLWTAFLFQQTLAPLGPALPCATRLLHPGCHRSGSPGLGEKLAGTSLTGALQDQWIESWWSMPCPKGRRITAGPCPESLWGSPSQVFALKKKVFPMKGKWNRASLSLCYATTKGYYVTFSRSKHNGIRLHSELDKAFTS